MPSPPQRDPPAHAPPPWHTQEHSSPTSLSQRQQQQLPSRHAVLGGWDAAQDPVPHPIPLGPLPSPLAPNSLRDLRTSVGEQPGGGICCVGVESGGEGGCETSLWARPSNGRCFALLPPRTQARSHADTQTSLCVYMHTRTALASEKACTRVRSALKPEAHAPAPAHVRAPQGAWCSPTPMRWQTWKP